MDPAIQKIIDDLTKRVEELEKQLQSLVGNNQDPRPVPGSFDAVSRLLK